MLGARAEIGRWGPHREEAGILLPPGELTNNTQEQKGAGPRGRPPPGSRGKCGGLSEMALSLSTCPSLPILPIISSTRRGWHALPSLCQSSAATPSPVTVCPLLTLCLCLLSPPCGCRTFSLSVCYLSAHLPAYIVICWPLPVNAPTVHLAGFSATCHAALPVLFLLSVCPRPAADTAFNSLCPSPFNFLVEGRGRGRHRVGHPLISYKLFLANDA